MNSKPVGQADNTKKIIAAVAAAVVLLAGVGIYFILSAPETKVVTIKEKVVVHDGPTLTGIAKVADMMKTPETAQEGLQQLEQMAEDQDADAVFLLSRLYFRSNSSSDVTPDSVLMMQKALGIQIDNKKAHELLLQTVKADPENYCALYELGCDFLGGEMRTEAVNRNLEKADQYFQEALKYAQKNSDADYVNRIERQIEKYK